MYITLLSKQRVTFVSDVAQAEEYSPYFMFFNEKSQRYVVSHKQRGVKAAGLTKEDAEACVMFCANEHIFQTVQKGA